MLIFPDAWRTSLHQRYSNNAPTRFWLRQHSHSQLAHRWESTKNDPQNNYFLAILPRANRNISFFSSSECFWSQSVHVWFLLVFFVVNHRLLRSVHLDMRCNGWIYDSYVLFILAARSLKAGRCRVVPQVWVTFVVCHIFVIFIVLNSCLLVTTHWTLK